MDAYATEAAFVAVEECFTAIEASPLPVVAAVEGAAVGAGCQLALAADLLVMAATACIGMPAVRLGIRASPPFVARVSRRAGKAIAADQLLTGRLTGAEEASRCGLAARMVPAGGAMDEARRLAARLPAPLSGLTAVKRGLAATDPPGGAPLDRVIVPATVDRAALLTAVDDFFARARSS